MVVNTIVWKNLPCQINLSLFSDEITIWLIKVTTQMQQTNLHETSELLLHDILIQKLAVFSISKAHGKWIKVAE